MTMLQSLSRCGPPRNPAAGHSDAWVSPEDWSSIEVGSTVEVVISAHHSHVGRVDAKTPDSAIVWVVSTTGHGRQMYGHRDGIRLRPVTGVRHERGVDRRGMWRPAGRRGPVGSLALDGGTAGSARAAEGQHSEPGSAAYSRSRYTRRPLAGWAAVGFGNILTPVTPDARFPVTGVGRAALA